MAVLAAFGFGYYAGRASVDIPEPLPAALNGSPDRELVELLARVDAAATPGGGVRQLTFPDALTGEGGELVVPPSPEDDAPVHVEGQAGDLPERGDLPPHGRWTLTAASLEDPEEAEALAQSLRDRELEAWVAPEQLDGETRYRVGVGGWGSKSEAEEALKGLKAKIAPDGAPVTVTRF